MIGAIVVIQKELVRRLNKLENSQSWSENMESIASVAQELEEVAKFVDRLSPFECRDGQLPGQWVLRNKKTLKPVPDKV